MMIQNKRREIDIVIMREPLFVVVENHIWGKFHKFLAILPYIRIWNKNTKENHLMELISLIQIIKEKREDQKY